MNWEETLERVRSAAQSCAAANLSRLRIEDGELAIEVRRSAAMERSSAAPPYEVASANGKPHNGPPGRLEPARRVLQAEFVGILRLARPLVAPGTLVIEDRELAYVESLGIRNPIRSGGAGRVTEILVGDGEPVDFGQKLFVLEPAH